MLSLFALARHSQLAHLQETLDAEYITPVVLDTLAVEAGLGEADLARKLVAVSSDGAGVMTGTHLSVTVRLSKNTPSLVSSHCMVHHTYLNHQGGGERNAGHP